MRLTASTLLLLTGLMAHAGSVAAQGSSLEKLTVNGYLSQAYARSDSLRVIGITEDGTTDYRRAALLFRYAMSGRESFVVQLSHRRLGDSPTMMLEDNVKLDWAFYQRKLADETVLRIGKAPMPIGIFNETRYVGTMMPFYRAPFVFYGEGAYTGETIEGVVLSQGIFPSSAWRLDVTAYGGSYPTVDAAVLPTPAGPQYLAGEGRAKDAVGGQLWLATPIPGVRVGAGGSRFTATGGVTIPPGEKVNGTVAHASAEAVFDHYALRAEALTLKAGTLDYRGAYAQGSVRLYRSVWLHALAERADLTFENIPMIGTLEFDWERKFGVGLNYQPTSNLVWKNEIHWTKGYAYEEALIDYMAAPVAGRHVISSVSVSF